MPRTSLAQGRKEDLTWAGKFRYSIKQHQANNLRRTMTIAFKIGDIVTPTHEDLPTVQKWAGVAVDNKYKVVSVIEQFNEIRVQPIPATTGHMPEAFMMKRFTLATYRVEGKEIKPAAIKVGDEILVSKTRDGFTQMRQGVVGSTKRQSHNRAIGNEGAILFFTEGPYNDAKDRLNWGENSGETFTLVKAAPDVDLLLERLTNSTLGQVVTFGTYLARRNFNTTWTILDGTKTTVESAKYLRKLIGEADVKWLKAEAK
jgi:hypothetical protein